jgi:hypothetical protein
MPSWLEQRCVGVVIECVVVTYVGGMGCLTVVFCVVTCLGGVERWGRPGPCAVAFRGRDME